MSFHDVNCSWDEDIGQWREYPRAATIGHRHGVRGIPSVASAFAKGVSVQMWNLSKVQVFSFTFPWFLMLSPVLGGGDWNMKFVSPTKKRIIIPIYYIVFVRGVGITTNQQYIQDYICQNPIG